MKLYASHALVSLYKYTTGRANFALSKALQSNLFKAQKPRRKMKYYKLHHYECLLFLRFSARGVKFKRRTIFKINLKHCALSFAGHPWQPRDSSQEEKALLYRTRLCWLKPSSPLIRLFNRMGFTSLWKSSDLKRVSVELLNIS